MRLIDADLLEREIYKWMPKDQETWMDSDLPPIENLVVSIMMTIQEQPTVDAIPVEWIKLWSKEPVTEKDMELAKQCEWNILEWLIADWQKRKEE